MLVCWINGVFLTCPALIQLFHLLFLKDNGKKRKAFLHSWRVRYDARRRTVSVSKQYTRSLGLNLALDCDKPERRSLRRTQGCPARRRPRSGRAERRAGPCRWRRPELPAGVPSCSRRGVGREGLWAQHPAGGSRAAIARPRRVLLFATPRGASLFLLQAAKMVGTELRVVMVVGPVHPVPRPLVPRGCGAGAR